jgi:hypothetical protein
MNKLKRQSFSGIAIAVRNHGNYLAGDKLQQDIFRWLSPPDPWTNHNVALASRHSGTAAWFVTGDILSEWKASGPSSLLWIHGKRELCPFSCTYRAGTNSLSPS